MPDTVTLRDSEGRAYGVPLEQVPAFKAQGFREETTGESVDRNAAETFAQEHGGVGGAVASGLVGGLSGLTLGLSDQALGALGADRTLRHLEAEHPYAAGGGQIIGALAPTVLTGGAAAGEEAAGIGARILAHSPAALAGKVGHAVSGLGEGAGLAARVAAGTAGAAAEGALYGGGQYLTETALEDKPLSAEGFVAGLGHGALFAAPIGAAGTLASATLQRAASLFPRSEVSAAAAAGVKEQATSALAQSVRDGDAMVQAAERKLSDIDAGTGIAQAGETATRRVFGGADPQAIADQVSGATARQEVAQALEGYQQARAQFQDWIATEADPELEKALANLTPGPLQTPALAAPKVPVGEFGAPGARGLKTPEDLQRSLQDSAPEAAPAIDRPATAVLRGGAKGAPANEVPAQEIVQRGLAEQPATAAGKRPGQGAPPVKPTESAREIGSESEFRDMQRELRSKLTDDEAKQALRFSREYYLDVNRALRGDRPPLDPKAAAEITPVLDRVIDKSVLDRPIVTHRAIHFDPHEPNYNLTPGDVLYDPGFGSTAWRSDNIHRFGNIHLEITSPAGTHIAAIPSSASEGELTLARGTSLKITDRIQNPDGKVTLKATVVKQDGYGPIGAGTTQPAAAKQYETADAILERHGAIARFEHLPAEGSKPERLYLHLSSPSGTGILSAERTADGGFEVGRTALDTKLRGKGVGTAMYERLNRELESKYGQPLRSAAPADRSKAAEALWKRLEERGLAERQGDRWVMKRLAVAAGTEIGLARIPGTTADRIEVRKVGNWRERKMEVVEYHNGVPGEPRTVSQDEAYELAKRSTPEGFNAHLLDSRKDFTIAAGVPKSPSEIVDNAVYVVRPSELADRGILGNKIRPDDLKRGAEGLADASVKFPTVEIDMAPNGEMWINDGNHRVQNAAATDRPMAVKFRAVDMTRAEKKAAGLVAETGDPDVDISGRIRNALPKGSPTAVEHAAPPASSPRGRIEVHEIGRTEEMRATMPDGTTRDLGKNGADAFLAEQMPPGFRPAKVRTHQSFVVEHGLPETAEDVAKLDENAIYIAKPSEIVRRDVWGDPLKEANRERVLEAWKGGEKLPPIDAYVTPEGRIYIEDGNHRLQAAAQSDRPVAIRFKDGTGYNPHGEAHEIGGRIREDLPKGGATVEPAGDDLLAQLRGTAAKVNEGQTIGRIGAESPARAEYVTNRAAKQKTAAEHFRAEALAKRTIEGPVNLPHSFDRAARAITGKSAEALAAELRGAPTGIPERARIAGRYAAPGPEVGAAAQPADPLAAFGLESDPTRLGGAAGEVPPEARSLALPERTRVDKGIKASMGAIREEAAIAKAILRHNGKNVDIGPSLARAAKAIGDVEEANAKLADALGAEAPATAVENAKAYRDAIKAAHDRSAASSAKAAEDLKTKVKPAADATLVDDEVTKALRQHDARAAAQAAKAPPAAKAPAAPPSTPANGSTVASAVGGRLADVGSALEVLSAIGAHVPAVSHIPVIGPILGLWLKARAVLGILGRKGGSIGKSTESVIASKAAATRDRIVAATRALLEGGARAAGKASHLAEPAALLGTQLFPGGEKPASDKPRDLFEARSSEITRAMQPGAIDQAIAQRYPTSDPELHNAVVAQIQRGIAFLDSKRPKQTVLPGVLPGDGTWAPSAAAIEEFGKYVHAVNDPVSVLEDLAKGHPSAEGAETLRVVYPSLYQYAQKELLKAAPEMVKTLPYSRRVMLSILYQIPVDGTMQPSHAQYLQVPAAPTPAPRAPAVSGPLKLGQQTLSPLDQRASGAGA